MQGFISWFCSWLKLVSNGFRLSKKIAAPIENRLTLAFISMCLVHECDGSSATSSAVSHRTLEFTLSRHELPKKPCLLSYDLWIRALPLLIKRAALVIELIEPRRLSSELAGIATCEDPIHFSDNRSRIKVKLNTAA